VPVVVGAPLWVRSLAGLSGARRWTALVARSLVMTLLILCLAGLQWTQTSKSVSVVYVLDRSDSIPPDLKAAEEEFVRRTRKQMKPSEDRAGLVTFGGRSVIEQTPTTGDYIPPIAKSQVNPGQSNLAEALRMAAAVFPPDTAKRIVILSDGNQTTGDALAEARRIRAADIGIDVVPLDYTYAHEVQVTNLWTPPLARAGDEVPLKISLFSQAQAEGELVLSDNGKPVVLDPDTGRDSIHVRLQPGKNALVHRLRMDPGGPDFHRFQVTFIPAHKQDDTIPQNNMASAFTVVAGKGKILLVTTSRDNDARFEQALREENIDVETVEADKIPTGLEEYQPYAAVVLSNVPADLVPRPLQESLASYVKDLGGGLVMLGGDQSYGAGGWIGSPVEKVMPLDFEIKAKRQMPRGALAMVMHASEMPNGNGWGIRIAQAAVDALTRLDYVGVNAFDPGIGQPYWVVPMKLARDKEGIKTAIDKMIMGDMPDFGASVQMALSALMTSASDAAQRHMIVISDGDPTPPSAAVVAQLKRQRITVSTVGIGMGYHVAAGSLKQLAADTGGRFYLPQDPNQLPQIFIKEARTVTRALLYEKPSIPVLVQSSTGLAKGLTERAIPPLQGLVLTTPKPLIEMPLAAKTDAGSDPLLANWQVGLGRSVAFTSGMWNRWGAQWLDWEKFKPFWSQSIRWAMRKSGTSDLDIQTSIEEGRGKLVIDAVDKTAGYLNFLEFQGRVIGPEMDSRPLQVVQTGPGRYEATFAAEMPGSYIMGFAYRKGGQGEWQTVQTGIASSYSPEYAQLHGNPGFLRQLAEVRPDDKGQVLPLEPAPPGEGNVFRRDLPAAVMRDPAWPTLLAISLALFLFDVAVRRIAIDPRAVAGGVRGWIGDLAGRWRGTSDKESLGTLKQRRQEVQEQWRQRLQQTAPGTADAPAKTTRRKYNPVPATEEKPTDAVAALGAGRQDADKPATPAKPAADDGSATSRLLQAKRRAQQKMEDDAKGEGEA
jgi:uncharacterized membrane protein/Mg-chelatase subunit ChlD